jgi:protein phosphatase
VAAWTTTGMVRSGNEDAFIVVHATEGREDTLGDAALVLLADGMGGSEAGEVAAALALSTLRQNLLRHPPFAALVGEAGAAVPNPGEWVELLKAAFKEANRQVYLAAHSMAGRRGMGCTAEAVFLSGTHLVVGHVGDSRTYLLSNGSLTQVTRDQTWVNRMVDLGLLKPDEAETHARRSELQQAVGGHSDVEPDFFQARLRAGDWVVVCSDGLSNHAAADTIQEMLLTAPSAESAARRLVNYVNLRGATDYATVVVVRAT